MIAAILTIASMVILIGALGYMAVEAYADRQFEKRYREFKRQQRAAREQFFNRDNERRDVL